MKTISLLYETGYAVQHITARLAMQSEKFLHERDMEVNKRVTINGAFKIESS